MVRSRMVTGIAVLGAVAIGGVGGALIGVPALSGAQGFPKNATQIAATATNKARPVRDSALLDAAAKALNLTTDQLKTKLSDGKTTIADVAKAQKVSIDTVITAMTNADHDRISDIVNKPWPAPRTGGPGGAAGPGKNFAPGGGDMLGRFGAVALDPLAKALGISPADLKADLAKGQTIAEIATAKNVDVTTVINTLVTDATKRIDQAVTDKKLTQAQADKLTAGIKTEITNLVNNGFPKGPLGGFGLGGRGPGHGMGHGPGNGANAQPGTGSGSGSGSGSSSTTTPSSAAPTS